MNSSKNRSRYDARTGTRILQLTILASMVSTAYAQEAAPMAPQTVTVTGYRASLASSAR